MPIDKGINTSSTSLTLQARKVSMMLVPNIPRATIKQMDAGIRKPMLPDFSLPPRKK